MVEHTHVQNNGIKKILHTEAKKKKLKQQKYVHKNKQFFNNQKYCIVSSIDFLTTWAVKSFSEISVVLVWL